MTDIFSQWLHAVIYTGIVCSIALMLSPDGRVKNALKILCAVAMCAAIVSPLSELDFDAYSKAMARCRLDAEQYADQGEQYSKNLNRTIIEGECRAYILDKAASLGLTVTVELEMETRTATELAEVTVTAEWSTDGYWYPHEVRIVSGADENQRGKLSDCIQTQLGISVENQDWSDGENG